MIAELINRLMTHAVGTFFSPEFSMTLPTNCESCARCTCSNDGIEHLKKKKKRMCVGVKAKYIMAPLYRRSPRWLAPCHPLFSQPTAAARSPPAKRKACKNYCNS